MVYVVVQTEAKTLSQNPVYIVGNRVFGDIIPNLG